MRSTEFIDDAARDNEATNKLEINDFGFAFGQLADRETWNVKLKSDPSCFRARTSPSPATASVATSPPPSTSSTAAAASRWSPSTVPVAARSATAGWMEDTYEKFSLMVARFQELREQAAAVSNLEGHFTTTEALTAYRAINAAMAANGGAPTDSTLGWTLVDESPGIPEARPRTELQLRGDALIAAIEADSAASPAVGTGCGWKHRHPTQLPDACFEQHNHEQLSRIPRS